MTIEVRTLEAQDFGAWADLVAASPEGSPYAEPRYLQALAEATEGRFHVLGAWRKGDLVGGLPLFEPPGALRLAEPRLLLYYLSPVLRPLALKYPSEQTARQVETLGALADAVSARSYDRALLKCRPALTDVRPFLLRGWSAWPSYSYEVRIDDLEQAWGRVEQNLRRLVRRCTDQGMEVVESSDFDAFYRLHVLTLERKDAAAYLPEAAFRRFFARLHRDGLARLYEARLPDGTPVASQLVLTGRHPVSHTVSAAADPAHLRTGVNALLRWRAFEQLSALGYRANDLTDAALNPVTHFKSQLGGDLVTCHVLASPVSGRWRRKALRQRMASGARGLARRILRPERPT